MDPCSSLTAHDDGNPSHSASPHSTLTPNPVLVDLTPLHEGDPPVFYPVNFDSIEKSLPPTPMSAPNGSPEGTKFPELPPAPPSKVIGQGYSANHPVPTVQSYKVTQAENEQQAKDYAEIVAKRQAEDEERLRRAEELKRQQDDEKHSGPAVEEVRGQGNAVKSNEKTKDKLDPNAPANEKTRMMEQMNMNKRKHG